MVNPYTAFMSADEAFRAKDIDQRDSSFRLSQADYKAADQDKDSQMLSMHCFRGDKFKFAYVTKAPM